MKEIYPRLYIGDDDDYESIVRWRMDWQTIHACRKYHQTLFQPGELKLHGGHPEYLVAQRGPELFLNFIDARHHAYIFQKMVDDALIFTYDSLSHSQNVLIHCNHGASRAPMLGLLYLLSYTDALPKTKLEDAEVAFRKLYPLYYPGNGVRGFLVNYWDYYVEGDP